MYFATAQIWTKFANLGYTRSSLLRMKLRLILINHFTAKVKNADLVDVRKLKRQNNNSYKKNKSLFHQQRGNKTQHPIISRILVHAVSNGVF